VTSQLQARAEDILAFWFGGPEHPERGRMRKAWFTVDPAFDDEIRQRFLEDHQKAATGVYDALADTARGTLALAILLDQVPRNIFRGEGRAYAQDAKARAIVTRAVASGFDMELSPVERLFIYLPLEHSEDVTDQRRCVALMQSLPATPEFPPEARAEAIDYAQRHLAIIERFGRFPHRNAALGRVSTPEEVEFLKQPGSRF
jgi:uncharacterized protein (DUF924 family)